MKNPSEIFPKSTKNNPESIINDEFETSPAWKKSSDPDWHEILETMFKLSLAEYYALQAALN